jgi:ribonuclease BN (tRNA processing enzyme)
MKVTILGSSGGASGSRQYVSSYLINGSVAIDAGCLGLYGTPEQQACVRHVVLTHAHLDHVASLPFFLENVWTDAPDCPVVYGSAQTLDAVRRSIFNDEVWPDFVAISERMPPFVRFQVLQPEVPIRLAGLVITPVTVNHSVPTFAYIVQEGERAVIFAGDSGPTTRLWQLATGVPGLCAVFLEASFPNRMKALAEKSQHLTSETFGREASKAPFAVKIIAVHLKAPYHDEIVRELAALSLSCVEIGECDSEYQF